jgi:hypothetical protein
MRDGHPPWCARGHRCGLGEHRSAPIRVEVPPGGHLVVTRVRDHEGHDHVEITGSVRLSGHEDRARAQLAGLLGGFAETLWSSKR